MNRPFMAREMARQLIYMLPTPRLRVDFADGGYQIVSVCSGEGYSQVNVSAEDEARIAALPDNVARRELIDLVLKDWSTLA